MAKSSGVTYRRDRVAIFLIMEVFMEALLEDEMNSAGMFKACDERSQERGESEATSGRFFVM